MNKGQINKEVMSIAEDVCPVISLANLPKYMEIMGIKQIMVDIMQRGGSWTEKEIEKMLYDTINANKYKKHNIGLCKFYLSRKEEKKEIYYIMKLIDFNQRMQNQYLFIAASKKRIIERGYKKNYFLNEIENILYQNDRKIKFKVYEDDQKIFEELIRNGETKQKIESKYNKRLIDNFNFITIKLNELDDQQFYNFVDNLLHNTTFILGETQEDPFKSFENHNVYVVPLSILEKLRNLTLSQVNFNRRNEVNEQWNQIFKEIYIDGANMDKTENKFFRNYMLSQGSTSYTYNCFVNKIENLNDEQIISMLKDIRKSIRYYKIYEEGKINQFINGLLVLDNKQGLPLFMLAFRLKENKEISEEQFEKICKLIFKLAFCYKFNDELPNKYGPIYKSAIEKILEENELKIENKIENAIEFLRDKVNDRKYGALKGFREKVFYTKKDLEIATYILKKIEKNEGTKVSNYEKMEIEHVLPKKRLEEQWTKLKNKHWFKDDVLYRVYAGKIGNLTLLEREDNSRLKESNFANKKVIYMQYKNKCILTYRIKEEVKWDQDTIQKRSKYLCDCLEKMWFK